VRRTTLTWERCLFLQQLQQSEPHKFVMHLEIPRNLSVQNCRKLSLSCRRRFPASWHCKDGVGVRGSILFYLATLQHMGRRQILSSHSMEKSSANGSESHPGPTDETCYYNTVVLTTRQPTHSQAPSSNRGTPKSRNSQKKFEFPKRGFKLTAKRREEGFLPPSQPPFIN